ncbi:MAG: fatty acid desaturase [Pseudomonadota bacterium]
MEGYESTDAVISSEELRTLNQRSNVRGALQTGSHILAIGLVACALNRSESMAWSVALFAMLGILINFLYAGQHELSHWTVFRTRSLNTAFGHLFGFILLLPREYDRIEHFQHHRHTQDPELDGELQGAPFFEGLGPYLWYASGIGYWLNAISRLLKTALARGFPPFFTRAQRRLVTREARCYLSLYLLIALASWHSGSWAAITYWLAPMLTMKFVHLCQNLAEHTGMPNEQSILVNTRTIHSNRVLSWLSWNMPYHMAHHSYPAVPFFRVPELHARMAEQLADEPETIGYLSYQWQMLKKLKADGTSEYRGRALSEY